MSERVREQRKRIQDEVRSILGDVIMYKGIRVELSDESTSWLYPREFKRINLSGGYGMPRSFVKIDEAGKWKEKLKNRADQLAVKVAKAREDEAKVAQIRAEKRAAENRIAQFAVSSRVQYCGGDAVVSLAGFTDDQKREFLVRLSGFVVAFEEEQQSDD